MAVERLPGNTKLHAQFFHLRLRLAHGGLDHTHLGGRHLIWPATIAPACPCCGNPGFRSLDYQFALMSGASAAWPT